MNKEQRRKQLQALHLDPKSIERKLEVEFPEQPIEEQQIEEISEQEEEEEELEVEETKAEQPLGEAEILAQKKRILDEIEARLKKEKTEDYIQGIADQYANEEDKAKTEEIRADYQKRCEIALEQYKKTLDASIRAYKEIIERIDNLVANSKTETQSLVLVLESYPASKSAKLLFSIYSPTKILSTKQITISKEKS